MAMARSGLYRLRNAGETISCPVPAMYLPSRKGLISTTYSISQSGVCRLSAVRNATPFDPEPHTTARLPLLFVSSSLLRHDAILTAWFSVKNWISLFICVGLGFSTLDAGVRDGLAVIIRY